MKKGILTKLNICMAAFMAIAAIWTAVLSCRKPFNPTLNSTGTGVLVVEGMINTGTDSTFIKLSRTVALDNKTSTKAETRASVQVEDDQNKSYVLTEIKTGIYALAPTTLSSTRQYRVRIKTTDGQTYLSDFEQAKTAPAIDNVTYKINDTNDGINLYTDTHDATNNTRYYRWEYEETWRFHSMYLSQYQSDGKKINPRTVQNYYCFTGDASTNVLINSSEKLSQDVISEQPLTTIASTSEKLELRYSILLKQYAISKNAYAFWTNLKKNTEQLGSIFDAQPSQLPGNIHCISNTSLPVIGYMSAGTIQTKRVFIDRNDLPREWRTQYPYECSTLDTLWYDDPKTHADQVTNVLIPLPSPLTIVGVLQTETGVTLGYTATSGSCADCTVRGYTKQPAFWQ